MSPNVAFVVVFIRLGAAAEVFQLGENHVKNAKMAEIFKSEGGFGRHEHFGEFVANAFFGYFLLNKWGVFFDSVVGFGVILELELVFETDGAQ